MMPSTVMGARKITIKGGSDVTNQTCLYPGVTVQPGACLGVFTYAEPERTFPRDCIVQVRGLADSAQHQLLTALCHEVCHSRGVQWYCIIQY